MNQDSRWGIYFPWFFLKTDNEQIKALGLKKEEEKYVSPSSTWTDCENLSMTQHCPLEATSNLLFLY